MTVFTFTCRHCGAANEHREQHRSSVQPHLVSTRCHACGRVNYLGGIQGTPAPTAQDKALDVLLQTEYPQPA